MIFKSPVLKSLLISNNKIKYLFVKFDCGPVSLTYIYSYLVLLR